MLNNLRVVFKCLKNLFQESPDRIVVFVVMSILEKVMSENWEHYLDYFEYGMLTIDQRLSEL